MSKLEELIEELCPEGVEYRNLGDICNILDSQRKPVTKKDRSEGEYPYYGANGIQDYVREYIFDGTFLLVGEDGSVINKDKSPVLSWAVGKIWVNNHAHVLSEKRGVLLRYIFHYMQTINVSSIVRGTPPKLNQQNLRKIKIAVPPVEIQREIVRILDSFTELTAELIAELTAELTARKKQYEYYRDDLMNLSNDKNIVTIGEVVEKIGTINWNKCEETKKYIDLTSVDKEVHSIIKKLVSDVNSENAPSRARQLIKSGDILFGGTRPMLKRYCIVPKEYDNQICSTGYIVLRVKNNLIIKEYLYYILGTQSFYNYIESNQQGASYPSIGDKVLKQYTFNLPSLREQEHIVKILNEFEKLYYDISEGIQAEIEARKKQYEYYRDKLLTFKKLEE